MTDLLIGAGAVGLGVGSALLAGGASVVFVARGETGRALARVGLRRTGLFGEVAFDAAAFEVLDSLAECDEAPDRILVAVKSTDSESVAREIASRPPLARSAAPVVLLQNGVGNAEVFARELSRDRVFCGRVITGFHRRSACHVEITAHADAIRLGSVFGADPGILAPLAATLSAGGLPAEVSDDVARDLWGKLLYNAALNPLGALLRVPYGTLARDPATRGILDAVMDEVFAVLLACGERTHWPDAESYRRHFYAKLIPPTASHESSMLQDVRAGRPTEIDALCGEVVRRGGEHGVETPVNEALLLLVRALERYPRPPVHPPETA